MPAAGVACMALALLFISCGSVSPARRAASPEDEGGINPRYSIVCIIHGDGNYLYHDALGDAHRADEVTLAKAIAVAERNTQAEMFIFHERRRKNLLLFIPRRDGTCYYYRYGRLIAEESYWRDQGAARFDPEMELYDRFRAEGSPDPMRLFLYFGHEIPEIGGAGYDASYKSRTFKVDDLANGLRRVTHDSTRIDLVVLSTCYSGTPHIIAALAPHVRYVIASPDNLHLSYFDLGSLEQLDIGAQNGDVVGFADTFAHRAFDKLTEDIQTTVTIAVYDVDRIQGYVRSIEGIYDDALIAMEGKARAAIERCDCAEDAAYVQPGMNEGMTVLYRSPRFGRQQRKENHSGWECWRVIK